MNFNWEKCSIQWMLIAIIISCLAYGVYCGTNVSRTRRTKTTAYTLLEDNPAYVQNFISKMMSKFPFNSSETPRDYAGVKKEPNLGYEPYWENFPDLTWAYKCARCPELSKKYKEVCAIDASGAVALNMSLCDVQRMNCLAGGARGHSTGIRNDFQFQYFVVKEGWAHVAIRQNSSAIIQLSELPSNTTGNRYTILIDGWNGSWSGMFRNDHVMAWYPTGEYRTLWEKKYVDFVMRWDTSTGWFLITVASATNWTRSFHFNVTDPDPFRINYIAVGGADNITGDWELKDFLVSTLTPCGPGAAKPLVTSPTEVSILMRSFSQINKSYFTRIMEADAVHNVPFLTQEEY